MKILNTHRIFHLLSLYGTAINDAPYVPELYKKAEELRLDIEKEVFGNLRIASWQERQQLSNGGAWTNWYECSHRPIEAPRQSLCGGIPIEWRPLYTIE